MDEHLRWTGSRRARELLDDWAVTRAKFVKVFPIEYQRALARLHEEKLAVAPVNKARKATKKEAIPAK